jgi:hypothetical protein
MNDLTPDHRKNIVELLFPKYWQPEAGPILDYCLVHGFTLEEIAYACTRFGVEALVVTAYTRQVGGIWGHCVSGPYTGPQWPSLIAFRTFEFGP